MVFESVVKEILNRYLGAYVENLDANQLNVGIWSGEDFCLHVLYIRGGRQHRISGQIGLSMVTITSVPHPDEPSQQIALR